MVLEGPIRQQSSWPSKAVCDILGITYRQLDLWIRSGLMRPSVAQAQGYGTARRFSFEDLVYIELIRQLLAAYVPLQSTKRALRHLQEHRLTLDDLGEIYLVTDGADYFVLYYSDHELDLSLREAMERGRPIISIALRQVVLGVQEKLGLRRRSIQRTKPTVQAVVNEAAAAIIAVLKNGRGNLEPDKLLRAVLLRTGAEFGELFLLDRKRNKLVLHAFKGLDDLPLQDKTEFALGKGLPGLVAQSGKPILRTFLGGEPRFMKRAQQKGIRFVACLPIKVGDVVIGTLHLASMQPTLFKLSAARRETV